MPPSTAARIEPPAILLCTLGMTWAVVPEIFGFVAPEQFDFYRDHPHRDRLRQQTATFPRPGAIWVVTTDAPRTTESLAHLAVWRDRLTDPPELRV